MNAGGSRNISVLTFVDQIVLKWRRLTRLREFHAMQLLFVDPTHTEVRRRIAGLSSANDPKFPTRTRPQIFKRQHGAHHLCLKATALRLPEQGVGARLLKLRNYPRQPSSSLDIMLASYPIFSIVSRH